MRSRLKCSTIRMCFNRYMVECECQHSTDTLTEWSSFNRYMVECELIHKPHESDVA